MKSTCPKRLLFSFILVFIGTLFTDSSLLAQNNNTEEIEVYPSFRYRGVINTVVVPYYKNDDFFLPVNELFDLFLIESDTKGLLTTGKFSFEQTPYSIDLEDLVVNFGDQVFQLNQDDFLIKDFDNYLRIDLFNEIFGLNFNFNLNSLTLSLETQRSLPVIEAAQRNQRRRIADSYSVAPQDYPLLSPRKISLIDGGFVDYSLTTFKSSDNLSFNYNANLGIQLIGGDLQGGVFGNESKSASNFTTNGLRWRYIIRDSPLISRVTIGQTALDGVLNLNYSGIRVSNQPVEPRRLFDEYEVDGSTIPQSEVELFVNNTLVDFQRTDDLGNYRFLTPLYYGTSQLDVKIFGPTGQIIERSRKIQVPFSFLQKGEFNYYLNVGYLDNPIIGTTGRSQVYQANGTLGLTNWLTAKAGVESYENFKTSYSTTISSRISTNYILTLEGVSDAYVRSSLNAVYSNSASLGIDYTNFTGESSIYNTSGNDQQFLGNIFLPLKILKKPINLRVSSFTRFRDQELFNTYRFNLTTRISKLNIRLGYTDRLIDSFNFLEPTELSRLDFSASYNISRSPSVPEILKGAYLRAQVTTFPKANSIESAEFLLSRSIFRQGRFQLSYGRNFLADFNSIRFNFIIDFNKIRTNSTVTNVRSEYTMTQNFRGSIGYDSNFGNFLLTSRNQVGRSGTAVQLFVDNNSNGIYDETDEQISEGTLRIGRIGSSSIQKNGVIYYTMMQPYFKYNMEMNKASVANPMLVPEFERFSIITDPNTFKKIEIPFYMSGVLEGYVERENSKNELTGVGGLKVLLKSTNKEFTKELRTFSDGSFYEYEVPPGEYEVYIDSTQLSIMNVDSYPEKINVNVRSLPEGDFIEGLKIVLRPKGFEQEDDQELDSLTTNIITLTDVSEEIRNSTEIYLLEQRLNEDVSRALRMLILAQNAFYAQDIEGALDNINPSLEFFKTAQGYALKGSILYFKGDRVEAVNSWRMALRYDPDIYIPTLEELDQRVTISSSD